MGIKWSYELYVFMFIFAVAAGGWALSISSILGILIEAVCAMYWWKKMGETRKEREKNKHGNQMV